MRSLGVSWRSVLDESSSFHSARNLAELVTPPPSDVLRRRICHCCILCAMTFEMSHVTKISGTCDVWVPKFF
jgi:hypothetical protein